GSSRRASRAAWPSRRARRCPWRRAGGCSRTWPARKTPSRAPTGGPWWSRSRVGSWRDALIDHEPPAHRPVVTTSRDATGEQWAEEARELARRVRGVYMPRDDRPLSFFFTQGYAVVVLGGQGMRVHTERGELFYHPGMGRSRIRRLRKGGTDVMVTAMGLERGQRVLDCTLGLGSDAGVASYVVGEEGAVVGWE